ncbi:MAG: hypothetical protein B5M48_03405 [Candidatus Omnitrophica bacterium 4484_213]|nr:MAG: hypothetical protein B5M48_03405 [Candidatus Omnitrophica bacterium 4484_213]
MINRRIRFLSIVVIIFFLSAYVQAELPKEITHQIERLKSNNVDECFDAAKTLGELGDGAAVPSLIEALKNKNSDVRTAVSWALAKIADKSSLQTLIKTLGDED